VLLAGYPASCGSGPATVRRIECVPYACVLPAGRQSEGVDVH
jgi:hypothetical protein